ncbi:MAG: hypothetical protein ABI317_02965, partial [Gaiellales bacterium]
MATIDARIRELRRELRGLSRRRRRRVLDEARDHLLSALEDGCSADEAAARLGEPRVAFAGFPRRRRTHRAALVAAPLAFLALATPVSGTLEQLGAGATPSQAAVNPIVHEQLQRSRCVAAWNAAASDHWRRLARSSGAQIAEIGVIYVVKTNGALISDRVPHLYGCTVGLKLARKLSPYQPYLDVYAHYVNGAFRFDRTLRGHTRTAAPAANARVDASGRLTLSDERLQQACPAGPVGTAVQSVVALSPRRRLTLGGTTRLSAHRQSFAVAVRNAGRFVIHGVIANLEVYRSTNPGAAVWRSKPVTVRTLGPRS